ISEKAADTILRDSAQYPSELERVEARAVAGRRRVAYPYLSHAATAGSDAAVSKLPDDTVGLALSGGGIRSATFCRGVLQALAERGRLRAVDMLSAVSGGGYIAGFLGRLYTRMSAQVADKPGRVSAILTDPSSPEVWWLRSNANYIASSGRAD